MSLNWSVQDCKDWQRLIEGEQWNITHSLIWHTMSVDVGRIDSAKNIDLFLERHHQISLVYDQKPFYTKEILERYQGLSTNVFTTSKAKWKHRVYKALEQEAKRKIKVHREEIKNG
jgi:hypothetical protein